MNNYDVIVVGGGHAGVEAAHAVFRLGLRCALVTFEKSKIGQMSCNPAIGGLGKSHIVREIDALGGIMAVATDMSGIQYRTLNTRKGDAVQALRVQCDRFLYKQAIQNILSKTSIDIFEEEVLDILVENDSVKGVITNKQKIVAKKTILTTGTFAPNVKTTAICSITLYVSLNISALNSSKLSAQSPPCNKNASPLDAAANFVLRDLASPAKTNGG